MTLDVVDLGATLRLYRAGGRDVIDGFAADESPPAAHGEILAPWPNRIAGGRYRAPDGSEQQLRIDEPARGNAIHGLVNRLPWEVVSRGEGEVEMACTLSPQEGYPFALRLVARYAVSDGGLECTVRTVNVGGVAAPYGIGHHPYIACPSGAVDDAVLHVPAPQVLESDERMIPTGRRLDVAGTPFDFRIRRRVGDVVLDTCYTALQPDADGVVRVTVESPQQWRTTLWMREPFRWLMVYSSDTLPPPRHRRAIAIEPMTCPPNAFQTGEDVMVLSPGESVETSWGITTEG